MTNSEKNIEIAKILGFKFIEDQTESGTNFKYIRYPESWTDEIKVQPVTSLPDFIEMFKQARKIAKMYEYGIPTDFNM